MHYNSILNLTIQLNLHHAMVYAIFMTAGKQNKLSFIILGTYFYISSPNSLYYLSEWFIYKMGQNLLSYILRFLSLSSSYALQPHFLLTQIMQWHIQVVSSDSGAIRLRYSILLHHHTCITYSIYRHLSCKQLQLSLLFELLFLLLKF